MSESREKNQLLVLKFFKQTIGWCGIRKLMESLPFNREDLMQLIQDMVLKGIIIKEIDVYTKKAWYHLPELTVQGQY